MFPMLHAFGTYRTIERYGRQRPIQIHLGEGRKLQVPLAFQPEFDGQVRPKCGKES